ncbi:DUF1707 domain-containing protein [Streptomyces sp. HNM0574]|uniref:DUF1707 SHOCT-like domain-containing protein n=1 Tax=Streptomyces sp. HNM0574 TaxID=2714954 RepID=UPI00146D2D58|nr:DUF1707 domain-containing protein [Streptomyces sp. HNM0574]NLU68938.1 DUF1707 domain-containing protein [Streptomyces sp. HNM0574]
MTDDLPDMRASDAERERVADLLRDALAEGRLDMDEFQERLDTAYHARTRGELVPLVRDLPAPAERPSPAAEVPPGTGTRWPERIGGPGGSRWGLGLLGGFRRVGGWTVPRLFTAVAFCGGGELDLREARFEDRETVIRCFAVMGGVKITVPPGVEVVSRGLGVMGGFDATAEGPGERGAPRVVVTGFAFWGGVTVERGRAKGVPELGDGGSRG